MKYMPLDLSVMQPEPFPHPVMMRSDLYARRQPSREEKWGICPGSVCGALRVTEAGDFGALLKRRLGRT